MIEVLEFIFQDSWHWLGTAILIAIIFRVNLVKIGPINFLHFFSSLFFVIGPIFTKLTRKMIAIKMAVPNQCQES